MRPIRTTRPLALFVAAPLACLAAACSPAREPAPANPPPVVDDSAMTGTCDAKAASAFVGQAISEDVAARAKAAAGARGVRIIRPGMAVTMDYRAGRLNLELDDAGRIVKASCG